MKLLIKIFSIFFLSSAFSHFQSEVYEISGSIVTLKNTSTWNCDESINWAMEETVTISQNVLFPEGGLAFVLTREKTGETVTAAYVQNDRPKLIYRETSVVIHEDTIHWPYFEKNCGQTLLTSYGTLAVHPAHRSFFSYYFGFPVALGRNDDPNTADDGYPFILIYGFRDYVAVKFVDEP